ncbi:rho guanine nucleotide exchange factor TIAM2 isoform X2 [Clupea harengus]|uniref:Rho guanine nucleotide exchange factor TIAM2 isoform X2 n=1 Tax=Clupea harengus TaxID=7950 RepID=A0A6P8GR87_CLUHA|nr:rho guanine nucleotide exchange factor TIAM2 isoform X2 [Clupea harengus]
MGNTDSQYSSFILPGKPRPCSLKLHSSKEPPLSPHSWWRGTEVGNSYKTSGRGTEVGNSYKTSGRGTEVGNSYKTGGRGRNGLSPHKSSQPYLSRHYDYVTKAATGGASESQRPSSPLQCERGGWDSCYSTYSQVAGEGSGLQTSEERTEVASDPLPSRNSPKVLFSQDGSMRVEFTNSRRQQNEDNEEEEEEEEGVTPRPNAQTDARLRTSNGSSLSSEGSWYDSPWGAAGELSDHVFHPNNQTADNSSSSGYTTFSTSTRHDNNSRHDTTCSSGASGFNPRFHINQYGSRGYLSNGYNTCSSGRTEDSGIGDSLVGLQADHRELERMVSAPVSLSGHYSTPSLSNPFPLPASTLPPQFLEVPLPHHRVSMASALDSVSMRECSEPTGTQYSSLTLPCRKTAPVAGGNARKDSLKSRIRRLSDWTGSLSRKKRRLQDPSSNEPTETFRPNSLAADTQTSASYWGLSVAPQPLSGSGFGSSLGLHSQQQVQSSVLRQNIYENFMQELETGSSCGILAEGGAQTSEGEGDQGEGDQGESSGSSLGSLEQLDLMFEKEQGVVRRAGWLSFKPLLTLHKDRKLELVTRRKWRQYWVTLKGCMLLFYETYGKTSSEQDLSPSYALLAEDSIVQAVPEHPKKENVFCLSNAYGDVYLFQAANQTDLENWVTAMHSASASLCAKRQGKEDTVRLLRSQTRTLLQKIDMDGKMKKMAELQLSVISDQKNRKAIESQIQQWEQNLEKFNMDLFRMRCYLASLQGSELPNPKSLLAVASRPSKTVLSRLGIFSVSSFHALICTRDEATLRRRSRSLSSRTRNKRGLFTSLKGLDNLTKRNGRDQKQTSMQRLDSFAKLHSIAPPEGSPWDSSLESLVCVYMPDGHVVTVNIKQDSLVADVLSQACKGRQLEPCLFGLRVKRRVGEDVQVHTASSTDALKDLVYEELEVFPLSVFTRHLSRADASSDFGFAVTGHVDGLGRSHIYISEVHTEGLAFSEGLRAGDEILVLNGTSVTSLDLGLMQAYFSQQSVSLVVWREEAVSDDQSSLWPDCDSSESHRPVPPPEQVHHMEHFPPWSSDSPPAQEVPEGSIAAGSGSEDGTLQNVPSDDSEPHRTSAENVNTLYQTFPEGSALEPEGHRNPYCSDPAPPRPCPRHMSITERLRKVIQELVDTEKSYVKDLGCLFEIYLKPLQSETFLTQDEMESLFGSLPEMLDFQRVFLHTLEERIASSPDFSILETPEQFKKLLFSLGGSFLYYADHFKLYSGFCANHIKVQKVLERAKTDQAFKEFLEARNPTKQHSSSLESYLIKPVQRVLKYPLLLRELVSLTDAESEEHSHLTEALRAMEKVASHINEMQKIYEDYGTVFDQLVAEQSSREKEVTEISMGEFLLHSSVLWLNPLPSLGRMRKDPELTLFLFKRAAILVYRESTKLKKRMTASRSAYSQGDMDPFKFRWLIPVSALQVRLGNTAGSDNPCIWELVHTKSEVEGRPETVFQLCSSGLESKANVVKTIRSMLRENAKRTVPDERSCRDHLVTFRRPQPAPPAQMGPWLPRQLPPPNGLRPSPLDLDGDCHSEPPLPSRPRDYPSHRSLQLDKRARLHSLTSALEAQLQRLSFGEEAAYGGEGGRLKRAVEHHQGGQGTVGLVDSQSSMDLNSLLARDFSVQSLASVVNEDCFYDAVMGIQKAAIPTL